MIRDGNWQENGDLGAAPSDGELQRAMSVEQIKERIRRRNAQFGRPMSDGRILEIEAGKIDPIPFEYRRAGFQAP